MPAVTDMPAATAAVLEGDWGEEELAERFLLAVISWATMSCMIKSVDDGTGWDGLGWAGVG